MDMLEKDESQFDSWSIWEKLILVSAVVKYGEYDWGSISVAISLSPRPVMSADVVRPPGWFSPCNCATQYRALVENHATLVSSAGEEMVLTSLHNMLKEERYKEIQTEMEQCRSIYLKEKQDIALCKLGQADDRNEQIARDLEGVTNPKEEAHALEVCAREGRSTVANQPNPRKRAMNECHVRSDLDAPPTKTCYRDVFPSTTVVHHQLPSVLRNTTAADRLRLASCVKEPVPPQPANSNLTMMPDIKEKQCRQPFRQKTTSKPGSATAHINAPSEVVCHPQYQEMWFSKGTDSDEIVDVVELEQPSECRILHETSIRSVGPNKNMDLCSMLSAVTLVQRKARNTASSNNQGTKTMEEMKIILADFHQEYFDYKKSKMTDENQQQTNLIIIRKENNEVQSKSLLVQSKTSLPNTSIQAETCSNKIGQCKPKSVVPFHLKQPMVMSKTIISRPTTPHYPAVEAHEYLLWKKSIMVVWKQIASHRYANHFLVSFMDNKTPLFYPHIFPDKKMDLLAIKKKIESGTIRNTFEFQRDIMSMFNTYRMFNGHDKHAQIMVEELQREVTSIIEGFLRSQLSLKCGGGYPTAPSAPDCPAVESNFKRRLPSDPSEMAELLIKRQKHLG